MSVTTASSETLVFDEVILTCPLGWLKRNLSSFTPNLPNRIIEAIGNISYGRLEKVYLTFPTAFWHHTNGGASDAFFSQWLPPTYTDQNPGEWSIQCVNLALLPEQCAHNTLLFYIHGPCAQYVTSLVEGLDAASQEYYRCLNDFFVPYYSRLPHYDPSSDVCKPTIIVATNWQNDEFSGWGSYVSCFAFRTAASPTINVDFLHFLSSSILFVLVFHEQHILLTD